ncbi:MAG: hypothetical protein KatS3mg059_0744 [Thermomicrobiales bacterium]|nr:MAG: hypothetical protein KatS3mg059_0744 [Thermomicrobiales bacterium]
MPALPAYRDRERRRLGGPGDWAGKMPAAPRTMLLRWERRRLGGLGDWAGKMPALHPRCPQVT